ncbi:MAG: hypothetical protein PF542_02600 [Nanoarchaeota archaeon]|jgi:ABC-type iron transport system FetAB permease component|nr:hypothetical protein [Nanoarchaeota archaeon]
MENKFSGVGFFILAFVLFFVGNLANSGYSILILIFLLIIASVVFSIRSLVKRENKKWIPIVILVISGLSILWAILVFFTDF